MTTVIDKQALLTRYRAERDKRLRTDGNDQYVEIAGQFAHYLEDPYTPLVEREPLTDHVKFAFVGGGFAGRHHGRHGLVKLGVFGLARLLGLGGAQAGAAPLRQGHALGRAG